LSGHLTINGHPQSNSYETRSSTAPQPLSVAIPVQRVVKWFQEVFLQRYWEQRCAEDDYDVAGRKVLGARMNPLTDRYPDIIENRLEGLEATVPAEVEWTTNDFRAHGHDLNVLVDSGGFLVVLKRTQEFPRPQVELHVDAVRDWLEGSQRSLWEETIRDIVSSVRSKNDPRGWIVWRSSSIADNYRIGLEHGVWGFPNTINPNRLASAQAIRKGDLLVFAGPWRKSVDQTVYGGRISQQQFLRGRLESVSAFVVTRGYFEGDEVVWPPRGLETWRHRVEIDPSPVFEARMVPTSKNALGQVLSDTLRRAMVGRSDPLELPEQLTLALLSAIGKARDKRA